MSNRPCLLELVICTHNNASLLEATLEAISRQETSVSECWTTLVVNNKSTDHTNSIVERYVRSGTIPGLRIIAETTLGLTPARFCAIRNTTAPWIAFIDDDCILQRDWVARAIEFASNHPLCGGFGGRVTLEWETLPPDYVLNFKYSFAEQELGLYPKRVESLVGAGIVVNRSALAAVGWSNHPFLNDRVGKKLISGGDVEIALRIGSRYELWYNPACHLKHFIPARRTTKQYLMRINFGLGSSKLFGDSMLWDQTDLGSVLTSLCGAWRQSRAALVLLLKAMLRGQCTGIGMIRLHFWLGYWAGIWRLLWMDGHARRQFIGCARPPVGI